MSAAPMSVAHEPQATSTVAVSLGACPITSDAGRSILIVRSLPKSNSCVPGELAQNDGASWGLCGGGGAGRGRLCGGRVRPGVAELGAVASVAQAPLTVD